MNVFSFHRTAGILPPYGAVSAAAAVLRTRTISPLAGETPALRRRFLKAGDIA